MHFHVATDHWRFLTPPSTLCQAMLAEHGGCQHPSSPSGSTLTLHLLGNSQGIGLSWITYLATAVAQTVYHTQVTPTRCPPRASYDAERVEMAASRDPDDRRRLFSDEHEV
jgi:hypothetical protein